MFKVLSQSEYCMMRLEAELLFPLVRQALYVDIQTWTVLCVHISVCGEGSFEIQAIFESVSLFKSKRAQFSFSTDMEEQKQMEEYRHMTHAVSYLDLLLVVGVLRPHNIYGHIRSVGYRLVTVLHTDGDFIVLPQMTWHPTQSHYPDTETTSPCPIVIMPSAWLQGDKVQWLKSKEITSSIR